MPDQWQVDSVTPTAVAPPPQQGAGQWQVDSVTPTAAPAQPPPAAAPPQLPAPGSFAALQQAAEDKPGTVGAGAMKTMRKMAAGLVEMADGYLSGAVPAGSGIPTSPVTISPGGPVDTALRKTSTYLRPNSDPQGPLEHAGAAIPDMMAFAAPELWGEQGATEAMSLADRVLATGRNLKTLEKNPGLLNMLKNVVGKSAAGAGRAALPAATATYVETGGDVTKTAISALTAAGLGAVSEGIPAAAGGVADMLRPTSEAMEGVTMPVAASQRPGASALTNLANPEALEDAQQAAAPQVIQNGAKRAVKNVLDEVNKTRGIMQGPAEQGGPPAGAFKFTVTPHGEPVETTDAFAVKKMLTEAQDLKDSPSFADMGPRQQAQVTNRIESYSQQLEDYHNELATRPHYTPIDVDAAVRNTDDYGTAGQNIQDSIDDIYQRMRGAANEQLDKKWLKQLSPNEFNELMENNTDKFSPEERQVATDTFRKGVALKAYHKAIQQGFNVSPEDAAATASIGGQRTFTGSNRISNDLDDVIAQHGADLRSMVGDQGITTVRRLNQLMKDPESSDAVSKIIHGTATILRRHQGLTGLVGRVTSAPVTTAGALAGSTAGTAMGGLWGGAAGTAGGAAVGSMVQKVINAMASTPVIADRIAYGTVNKISTRVLSPLIARMVIRATDEPQKPQEKP